MWIIPKSEFSWLKDWLLKFFCSSYVVIVAFTLGVCSDIMLLYMTIMQHQMYTFFFNNYQYNDKKEKIRAVG